MPCHTSNIFTFAIRTRLARRLASIIGIFVASAVFGGMVVMAEGVEDWRRLAETGDGMAQYRLGEAYEYGRGMPRNLVMAYAWYNLGAASEDRVREAKHSRDRLVRLLSGGEIAEAEGKSREIFVRIWGGYCRYSETERVGVPRDAVEMMRWLRLKVKIGQKEDCWTRGWQQADWERSAEGRFAFGRMYARGDDVPRDAVFAYVWFRLAEADGHRQAGREREELKRVMTGDEVREAEVWVLAIQRERGRAR